MCRVGKLYLDPLATVSVSLLNSTLPPDVGAELSVKFGVTDLYTQVMNEKCKIVPTFTT